MITIEAILTAAKTAIRNSSAISTFCSSNFDGATIKIFVGENKASPPDIDDAPFVVIAPPMDPYDVGAAAESREPGFEVDWGIEKAAKYVADTPADSDGVTLSDSNNTIQYDGQILVDQLGMLILGVLATAFTSANGENHLHVADYTLGSMGPLWEGGMSIKLHYEQGMGEATL